ncbi:MAG: TonB-dependent receptor domain-containing protein [Gammaproteobacteria bacterium]
MRTFCQALSPIQLSRNCLLLVAVGILTVPTVSQAAQLATPADTTLEVAAPSSTETEQRSESDDVEEEIETITVVGSQIQGSSIRSLLPVSVIDFEEIEALGVESGDGLLNAIAENGQNFLNEAENISGGVNSARGDVGAYNLRNLGTGNTLALLNGRRLVNSATFQTEEIGGSFVPVSSANTNVLPVYGIQRVEVLRDGASAIYGADAVSGVVNTVLKNDFDGLNFRVRQTTYNSLGKGQFSFNLEYGANLNGGDTNLGVFFDYYDRDAINSQDDSRWADSDFRYRIPEGSLWEGNTSFRNDSANSGYGQFDVADSVTGNALIGSIFDSAGEFEVYPISDAVCDDADSWAINSNVCGAVDGNGLVRYNLNADRDLRSDLGRTNLFFYLNHNLSATVELFSELAYYSSDTELVRHPSASFSSVKLRVGADNFYNPLGSSTVANRLGTGVVGTDLPDEGYELIIDNYRLVEVPRIVDNSGTTYRALLGFAGELGSWDWEVAGLTSKATRDDVTHNRVSNTLLQEALNDSTAAAYNPFSGSVDPAVTNIGQALVSVYRNSEAELTVFDAKFSTPSLFSLGGRPAALLLGFEQREESFADDRDPRLDGTIVFTDGEGDTYPYVSDVVNSSPTPDSSGSREVTSYFSELLLPLRSNVEMQLALRMEDFSDIQDDSVVGKVALGWHPTSTVLIRGAISQTYRAPNLVQINESIVSRQNSRTDYVCLYADPTEATLDCNYNTQRTSEGSRNLLAEESDNLNLGIVYEPTDDLVLTLDYWSIEKTSTIGLFGEENHTIIELLNMLDVLQAGGTLDCSQSYNSQVVRTVPSQEETDTFEDADLCPLGEVIRVDDVYENLDPRTVTGLDLGLYYSVDSSVGKFKIRYNASRLMKYEQTPGAQAQRILTSIADPAEGTLTSDIQLTGFGDLIGADGNQKYKHLLTASWSKGGYRASLSWNYLSEFYQSSLTLADGTRYEIPAFETYNASFTYKFDRYRLRFGVNNIFDERAPLADRYFGYFSDAHSDYGTSYYFELKVNAF